MAQTKTEFKWFTVPQYKREEEYLRKMHNNGWKLSHVGFPGFYHFTKCTPEDVVYQLDYNVEGTRDKKEYVQMFSDFGWEYLFDFVGFSYFRKPVQQMNGNEEIFCDDESRLEMMKRIYKGRLCPLLIIFFSVIIPQFFMQTAHVIDGDPFRRAVSILYFILLLLYTLIFITFGFQFFSFEKKVREPDKSFRSKYIALSTLVLVLFGFVLFAMTRLWIPQESKYNINTLSNQYSVSAEFLNDTLTHELSLQKGDQLECSFAITDGELNVNVCSEEGTSIYEGNLSDSFSFSLHIPETETYKIIITGKKVEGSFLFQPK